LIKAEVLDDQLNCVL